MQLKKKKICGVLSVCNSREHSPDIFRPQSKDIPVISTKGIFVQKLQPKSKFKKPKLPLMAPTNPNPNRPFPQSDGIKRSKLIKEGTKTDRPISLPTLTPPYIKPLRRLSFHISSFLTLSFSLSQISLRLLQVNFVALSLSLQIQNLRLHCSRSFQILQIQWLIILFYWFLH